MNFTVTVTERLERQIAVSAASAQDAIDKVYRDYNNGKIILDANDYTGTDFDIEEE